MNRRRYWLSLILLLPLSANACFVGAVLIGGAATLVIKQGFIDEDTYGGVIKTTPGKAYTCAIEVMDDLCHKIVMERAFRSVEGSWGSSDVEVTVEDIGDGEVYVKVKSRKYLMADRDTAVDVFQKILLMITGQA